MKEIYLNYCFEENREWVDSVWTTLEDAKLEAERIISRCENVREVNVVKIATNHQGPGDYLNDGNTKLMYHVDCYV